MSCGEKMLVKTINTQTTGNVSGRHMEWTELRRWIVERVVSKDFKCCDLSEFVFLDLLEDSIFQKDEILQRVCKTIWSHDPDLPFVEKVYKLYPALAEDVQKCIQAANMRTNKVYSVLENLEKIFGQIIINDGYIHALIYRCHISSDEFQRAIARGFCPRWWLDFQQDNLISCIISKPFTPGWGSIFVQGMSQKWFCNADKRLLRKMIWHLVLFSDVPTFNVAYMALSDGVRKNRTWQRKIARHIAYSGALAEFREIFEKLDIFKYTTNCIALPRSRVRQHVKE